MANAVSTAGIIVKWCAETTVGSRPTTGYATIPGVKSIPELFNDPNLIQSTPLSATKNHTFIEGLAGGDGNIAFTVNDESLFRAAWGSCITAYEGLTDGKTIWFEIAYGDNTLDSFYFPGKPLPLGFGGAEVDSVLENNMNIAPQGDFMFATAST